MANWGIRISKPTFDVKTCTDDELVMSSSFNLLKTKMVGTVSGTETLVHGLPYVPIFMSCEKMGEGTVGLMGQMYEGFPGIDGTSFVSNANEAICYIFYQQAV